LQRERTGNTPEIAPDSDDRKLLVGRQRSLQALQATIDARIEDPFPSEELRELALLSRRESDLYQTLRDAVRAGETEQIKREGNSTSTFTNDPTRVVHAWFSREEFRKLREAIVRDAKTPERLADALRVSVLGNATKLEPGLYANLVLDGLAVVDYRHIADDWFAAFSQPSVQGAGDPKWRA
jgi:hypothetical protein